MPPIFIICRACGKEILAVVSEGPPVYVIHAPVLIGKIRVGRYTNVHAEPTAHDCVTSLPEVA